MRKQINTNRLRKRLLTLDGVLSPVDWIEIDDDGASFGRLFGNNFDKFVLHTRFLYHSNGFTCRASYFSSKAISCSSCR